ncbi:hypothetical protein [Stenotrophomonas sp. WZN-1]|uniref:hypothetical protein n=1 Tax=Stenotrophomonas sp. WZN-1 TaxID=2005046 RepID=UPI001E47CA03|nr:hypothetical protein [Stenotrophomonas sp. WZN-1]
MQAPRLRSVGDAGPVRPDLGIQPPPVDRVAAGNGVGLRLGCKQQRPGSRHLAIVIGFGQDLRPRCGNGRGQATPYLRRQLQLILSGDRQQCLPVVLQQLWRLIAGELHHAGQQLAALAISIATPGLDTDRRNRFVGQQIQRHVEKGRTGRTPGEGQQHQRTELVRLLSGQRQQHALAVVARARGVMQVEDGADRVAHAGLLAVGC